MARGGGTVCSLQEGPEVEVGRELMPCKAVSKSSKGHSEHSEHSAGTGLG
jgi:hypothetical protein